MVFCLIFLCSIFAFSKMGHKKIISGLLLVLILFLNPGLALWSGNSLHAHFLSDNQIVIHYHHFGCDQSNGLISGNHIHCPFSITLIFFNNSQSVYLKNCAQQYITREFPHVLRYKYKKSLLNLYKRGPPELMIA